MKKLLIKIGVISAAILGLLATAEVARGAGETYYFSDTERTVITGEGGSFGSNKFQLTKGADTTFSAIATYPCETQTTQGSIKLQLDIAQTDYDAKKDLTPATISLDNSSQKGCGSPGYDATTEVAASLANSTATAEQRNNECYQGSFTWFACPLVDTASNAITSLATDFLTPLLAVKPISQESAPDLHRAWESIRLLANILFVLVFLFFIFAYSTSFALDQYTLKKMLPRLVIASILVQFSFLLSAFIIDVGNVLGFGIHDFFLNFFNTTSSPKGEAQEAQNILIILGIGGFLAIGNILNWIFVIPLLIGLIAGILAFFLIMAIRFFLLATLVVISPLAFVAWVLPNTEGYYQIWYKLFTRLVIMFPLIMLILALAGRVNQILTFAGGNGNSQIATDTSFYSNPTSDFAAGGMDLVLALMRPLLAIAVFYLVIQTFKWAGGILSLVEGKTRGGLRDRLVSRVKDSDSYKEAMERRLSRQTRLNTRIADSPVIKPLRNSRNPIAKAAGGTLMGAGAILTGGGPATARARQKAYSSSVNRNSKDMSELFETSPGNLANVYTAYFGNREERAKAIRKLQVEGEGLLNYVDYEGAMAAANRMTDFKTYGWRQASMALTNRGPRAFNQSLQAAGRLFSDKPAVFARHRFTNEDEIVVKDLTGNVVRTIAPREVKVGDVDFDILGGQFRSKSATEIKNLHAENFTLMYKQKDVAAAAAYNFSGEIIDEAFKPGGRYFMGEPGKRLDMTKAVMQHPELFQTGNGRQIKQGILAHLDETTDILPALARHAEVASEARIKELEDNQQWDDLRVLIRPKIENGFYKNED